MKYFFLKITIFLRNTILIFDTFLLFKYIIMMSVNIFEIFLKNRF